jgi:hypothetical protein
VDKRKIQEFKSKGSKAVGRKDFLFAAECYSMVCYSTIHALIYTFAISKYEIVYCLNYSASHSSLHERQGSCTNFVYFRSSVQLKLCSKY